MSLYELIRTCQDLAIILDITFPKNDAYYIIITLTYGIRHTISKTLKYSYMDIRNADKDVITPEVNAFITLCTIKKQ